MTSVPRSIACPRAWLLLTVAVLALVNTGCLEFEKQTVVLVFPEGGKEIRGLFVYEGLYVNRPEGGNQEKKQLENDLKDAMVDLAELVRGDAIILGDRMIRLPLNPRKTEKLSPEDEKLLKLFKPHITIHPGLFLTSADGKFTYCQPVTLREPQTILAAVNPMISQSVLKDLERKQKDPPPEVKGNDPEKRKPDPPLLDEESTRVMKKAIEDGHAWVRVEPGRLAVVLPGTPTFFSRMRQQTLRPNDTASSLRRNMEDLLKQQGDTKMLVTQLKRDINSLEGVLEFLAGSPWGVEQKHNQLTFTLGWGNGEPFRMVMPARRHIDSMNDQDKALLTYAKSLGAPVRENLALEAVLAEFQKSGKLHKQK